MHPGAPPFLGIWKIWRVIRLQLPLPRNAGAISERLHQVAKGPLFRWKDAETSPVPVILPARHDL